MQIFTHSTRYNHLYRIPWDRIEIYRNSYFVQGLILWNLLDDKIKLSTSLDSFKKYIKYLLLENKITHIY